jgi:hypothetical protein
MEELMEMDVETPAEPVQCPECNAYGAPTDRYCACCGAAVRDLCSRCSAIVIDPAANFCTQCGVQLSHDARTLRPD